MSRRPRNRPIRFTFPKTICVLTPVTFTLKIVSTMNERPLWEARLPLDELARAPFPKLVVSGDWFTRSELARELAGRTFNRVCDVIAERTGAERVVFPGAAHNPQLEQPEAFNRRLRDLPRYGRRSARRRPLNRGPGAVYHLSERRE